MRVGPSGACSGGSIEGALHVSPPAQPRALAVGVPPRAQPPQKRPLRPAGQSQNEVPHTVEPSAQTDVDQGR